MEFDLKRKLTAEFLGTAGLVAVVVGSGIMGENLSKGNDGIALLANSIATGAGLYFLITAFINISGAHFNPVVTLVDLISKKIKLDHGCLYMAMQIFGGVTGTVVANLMFDFSIFEFSSKSRLTPAVFLSEVVATFGLVGVILAAVRFDKKTVAPMVALYITAAYWFTSSTSFANPAVTIARMFTNTFTGIVPSDVLGFLIAQIIGGVTALFFFNWLLANEKEVNLEDES